MTPTTVIVVPVLNRPHRVAPLLADIAAATPEPHRVLFVVEDSDRAERAAIETAGADHLVVHRSQRSYARKINAGVMATTEPVLFFGADDIRPHPGWLSAAMAMLVDPVQVVGTADLLNPRVMSGEHSTHSLVSRSYCERGTIDEAGRPLHEGYQHDYCDDEFVGTAKARGAFAHCPDAIVEHLHHWNHKAPVDSTYRLGRSYHNAGRRLFSIRRRLWESVA